MILLYFRFSRFSITCLKFFPFVGATIKLVHILEHKCSNMEDAVIQISVFGIKMSKMSMSKNLCGLNKRRVAAVGKQTG